MTRAEDDGRPALSAPPDGLFPRPPVAPLHQTLPFGDLSWENFERLCHRLASKNANALRVERYGRAGQVQQGIDLYIRKIDGRYNVWQAKRYKTFDAAKVRKAVDVFLTGSWPERTDILYLAVQAGLDDTKIQDEIERQADRLAERSITFIPLDGDRLSTALKPYPSLVRDFFGRGWVQAFYGQDADPAILTTLDGPQFHAVREQLAKVYTTRFNNLDQGMLSPLASVNGPPAAPPSLVHRYTAPDVLIRERRLSSNAPAPTPERSDTAAQPMARLEIGNPDGPVREDTRRAAVETWLMEGEMFAVSADAGAGKTTLLRCVALDLLGTQTLFPRLAGRWGERLPLFISFAAWSRAVVRADREVGLKEIIKETLEQHLTVDLMGLLDRAIDERRIVLLIDGLDEWSVEQAARTTLQTLLTFVGAHELPTVVCGRPRGLSQIGALPQTWKAAQLAPLSPDQQQSMALTWFAMATPAPATDPETTRAAWQTERFVRELKNDPALSVLAQTPLLLLGLLALSLRNLALPRNRTHALGQLVSILLEIHPQGRATAAGDAQPRFIAATSIDLRQSALAALAYASRCDDDGGGLTLVASRVQVRKHLSDPDGHGLDPGRAQAAAEEILAVNAETVGLLIEKGPGEIGFPHASLEEYLAALHLQEWPLDRLLAWIEAHAGQGRWRNVIGNLVGLTSRPSEIDQIIAAIERPDLDALSSINRRQLLAAIAFSPARTPPQTARRLASATFDAIGVGGWEGERAALLALALQGLADPVLEAEVQIHIRAWAPRRFKYAASYYGALQHWPADGTLLDTLWRGLHDEDASAGRVAAQVLALKYADDPVVAARLMEMFSGAGALPPMFAAFEALVHGWPAHPALADLIRQADRSQLPHFKVLAVWARVRLGQQTEADLETVLPFVTFFGRYYHESREIALQAVLAGWLDHPSLIDRALRGLGPARDETALDMELASTYLRRCRPDTVSIQQWILAELDREFPFNVMGSRRWDDIVPFAKANPAIHDKLVTLVVSSENKHRDFETSGVIAGLNDPRLRDHAIERARVGDGISRFWMLRALVDGWHDDPVVQTFYQEVLSWNDETLVMAALLLPKIMGDPTEARSRLLAIARCGGRVRIDTLLTGFDACGCGPEDEEVVTALLDVAAAPTRRTFSDDSLFVNFGAHPKVRALAEQRLAAPEPALSGLVQAYADDPAMRNRLAVFARSAGPSERQTIVNAAAIWADRHPVLADLLAQYRHEVDLDLSAQLATAFYKWQAAGSTDRETLISDLLRDAVEGGIDGDQTRCCAFMGLLVFDAVDRLVPALTRSTPIILGGEYTRSPSPAVCRAVVSHWPALKAAFGGPFADQLGWHAKAGADRDTWIRLAPFVAGHTDCQADFIAWCERSKQIGLSGLRALSDLAPASPVLKQHCESILTGRLAESRDALALVIVAAEIVRRQFPGTPIAAAVAERFSHDRLITSGVALAILDPTNALFDTLTMSPLAMGATHGEWLPAVVLSAAIDKPETFLEVVRGMLGRAAPEAWEDQGLMTQAIIRRLEQDTAATKLMRRALVETPEVYLFAGYARLLSRTGALQATERRACVDRLDEEQKRKGVPAVVFDPVTAAHRPVSHALADALQSFQGF